MYDESCATLTFSWRAFKLHALMLINHYNYYFDPLEFLSFLTIHCIPIYKDRRKLSERERHWFAEKVALLLVGEPSVDSLHNWTELTAPCPRHFDAFVFCEWHIFTFSDYLFSEFDETPIYLCTIINLYRIPFRKRRRHIWFYWQT